MAVEAAGSAAVARDVHRREWRAATLVEWKSSLRRGKRLNN